MHVLLWSAKKILINNNYLGISSGFKIEFIITQRFFCRMLLFKDFWRHVYEIRLKFLIASFVQRVILTVAIWVLWFLQALITDIKVTDLTTKYPTPTICCHVNIKHIRQSALSWDLFIMCDCQQRTNKLLSTPKDAALHLLTNQFGHQVHFTHLVIYLKAFRPTFAPHAEVFWLLLLAQHSTSPTVAPLCTREVCYF